MRLLPKQRGRALSKRQPRQLQFRGANVDPGWRPGVLPRAKAWRLSGLAGWRNCVGIEVFSLSVKRGALKYPLPVTLSFRVGLDEFGSRLRKIACNLLEAYGGCG